MLIALITKLVQTIHGLREFLEDIGIVVVGVGATIVLMVGGAYAFGLIEFKKGGRTKDRKFLEKIEAKCSTSSASSDIKDSKSKQHSRSTRGVKMSTHNGGARVQSHCNVMEKSSADILDDLDGYLQSLDTEEDTEMKDMLKKLKEEMKTSY
jgi:hypothetical protein